MPICMHIHLAAAVKMTEVSTFIFFMKTYTVLYSPETLTQTLLIYYNKLSFLWEFRFYTLCRHNIITHGHYNNFISLVYRYSAAVNHGSGV